MNSSHLIIALCLFAFPLSLHSQYNSKVDYDKPGDWVTRTEADMNAEPHNAETEGTYYLLIDKQANIVNSEKYFRAAYRIITIDGLQQEADITVNFDPVYEQLVIHEAKIIRNGTEINKLNPVSVKVVQREQQMDRYLYDGNLTAIIHLSDLRIGDIVEYSYSKKGFNPVLDGHYSDELYFQYSVPYERGHFRVITPISKNLQIFYRNGEDPPTITKSGTEQSYSWNFNKMPAMRYEVNTPGWHDPSYRVLITDFKSWNDLNPWAMKHYELNNRKISKLKSKAGDYFKGENDQETALNVIRFVQDEVRYLGFEDGMHSHKPHEPLKVFEQRFGDCKDKSMLLCALLGCYNIEAYPVLVNSSLGEQVDSHMPAISSFNHLVTQVIAGGDTIFVDPTISNQGGTFNNIFFPEYGKGFVVNRNYGGMMDISQDCESKIEELKDFNLEAVGNGSGLIVQTTYTGGDADGMRQQLASNSLDMLQQNYLDFYSNHYPGIETEYPLKIDDNRDENILETTEYYHIPELWTLQNNDLNAEFFSAGLDPYVRIAKSNNRRKAPYQLSYPTSYQHNTIIRVPEPWNVEENKILIDQPEYKYFHQTTYANQEIKLYHEYQTLQSSVPVHKMETFVNDHERILNNLTFQLYHNKNFVASGSAVAAPPLVITILTLLAGIWLMIKAYRYDPEPETDIHISDSPKPLGGWLILFSIGIALSPVVLIYTIFIDDSFYNPAYWPNYMHSGNITYSVFISLQLIFNLILLLFSIVLAVLYFQRRSNVPRLVLIRMLGNLFVTMVIMAIGASVVPGIEYSKEELYDLSKLFIGAAIWVPYFLVSKRVKATFLNRLNPPKALASPPEQGILAGAKEV